MKIELKADEVNHITYALGELANRRQEQALDYKYNTIAKRANLDEALAIRRLMAKIRTQTREQ